MIKCIIFDCFGVLSSDGWLAFRQQYLVPDSDADHEAIRLNRQSDAGLLTPEDFVHDVANLAQVDQKEAVRVINQSHVPNDELFIYIRDVLKPNYKIGLLSNAGSNHLADLFLPWQVGLFDAVTFSFELGVVKPDPLMYETIAAKLGLLPEECLFIDDREGFVAGALASGMQSFLFVDTKQCQAEITKKLTRRA